LSPWHGTVLFFASNKKRKKSFLFSLFLSLNNNNNNNNELLLAFCSVSRFGPSLLTFEEEEEVICLLNSCELEI